MITIYVYAGWYSDHYVCIYLGFDTMITMFLGFLPVLLINLEVRAGDFDQYGGWDSAYCISGGFRH